MPEQRMIVLKIILGLVLVAIAISILVAMYNAHFSPIYGERMGSAGELLIVMLKGGLAGAFLGGGIYTFICAKEQADRRYPYRKN
jgi:hypothetical protein